MAEATKTLVERGVVGDLRYEIWDITNLANGQTITTGLNDALSWFGVNKTTADVPFGASKSISNGVAVLTAIVSSTTDEYRVTVCGK